MKIVPWMRWAILTVFVLSVAYFMPYLLLTFFPHWFPDYEPGFIGNTPHEMWANIIRELR